MKNFLAMFGTKTVWSSIAGAALYVTQNDPHNLMTWVNALVGVFGVVSARSAIDKSGAQPNG
ncbi:hypothetical protein UFOVP1537_7 [uncultured Caudovirales phage]|uniref:Holin n=2 Tax=root TaxID=1 RepID=A0A6J5PH45_9CAUD|nr:hypothetical protein UFOVP825_25 [uncultured Caudovirales phage]CAB4171180.1 hypothetical protein UFOVP915_7 [uncultured Caudovirales phage]CAB4177207.1 hypothetical protein UFOVP1000_24 [uncultured Caudovirales phage]CAB4183353.1 hypothetical protein UFOVP1092_52 [uncultured Caudovirales phage]CAB4187265.1 hypothetical protein UFOVP1152_3 [uncultured Caudovirales phage]